MAEGLAAVPAVQDIGGQHIQPVPVAAWPYLGFHADDGFLPLSRMTVKLATHLQLAEQRRTRLAKFAAFASLATRLQLVPYLRLAAPAAATQQEVVALLPHLWRLRLDNHYKEVYWRLVLNALPTAARMPGAAFDTCACGCKTLIGPTITGSALWPDVLSPLSHINVEGFV